jgi:hypothetical protein
MTAGLRAGTRSTERICITRGMGLGYQLLKGYRTKPHYSAPCLRNEVCRRFGHLQRRGPRQTANLLPGASATFCVENPLRSRVSSSASLNSADSLSGERCKTAPHFQTLTTRYARPRGGWASGDSTSRSFASSLSSSVGPRANRLGARADAA